MAIGKLCGMGSLQEQFAYMAMAEGASHKRIPDALFVESSLGVKDLLTQASEDIVRELVGSEEIEYRLVNPDIELDLIIVNVGVANQVNPIKVAKNVFGFEGEAEVGLGISGPCFPIPINH
jgi:hypothetical protein